jgi:hypothetical protein
MTTLIRHLVSWLLMWAWPPLGAQSPATVTWTGSLQQRGSPRQELRYLIPAAPASREAFQVATWGGSTPWKARLADVRFDGVNFRFRSTFASGARCDLQAVPMRGYAGSCVLATGDTAALTLVPPVVGMLLPDHEVALAREAAPATLADGTTVYVLGVSGYFEALRGTNQFTCIIERPTPGNVWPTCQTQEAFEALLPTNQLRVRLRAAGLDESHIADSLAQGYARGRFRAPASGAMAYMLSEHAWTMDPSSGAPVFLPPHLHFYLPGSTDAALGIDLTRRDALLMRVEREGEPDASVVVIPQTRGQKKPT